MDPTRVSTNPVAVPIVAGTAVTGAVASLLLYRVLRRHPHAFIVSLSGLGLTRSIDSYQSDLDTEIRGGLERIGLSTDSRLVVVGHSQGGLAAARYAMTHPRQVRHAVTVGTPWSGLPAASKFSAANFLGISMSSPALADMEPGSDFLRSLHADLAQSDVPFTNVYSASDLVIQPYQAGHLPRPSARNVLLATEDQYRRHLLSFPSLAPDEVVFRRSTHFDQMNCAEVRSIVWEAADRVAESSD